jgi:hypothetical protein
METAHDSLISMENFSTILLRDMILKYLLILRRVFIRVLKLRSVIRKISSTVNTSVAEPHHFYAAPAPGKNFDAALASAAPAPAPAPTLQYSKAKFLKV